MDKIYAKHICLCIFTTIICIIFLCSILQDTGYTKTGSNRSKETCLSDIEKDFTTADNSLPVETTTSSDQKEKTENSQFSEKKAKKKIDFSAEHPFLIRVNRAENFVTVYGINFKGKYKVPYKTFICSTGKYEESTPLGTFTISDKYRWQLMVDGTYAQYAVRIYGHIMLHSVPYIAESNDTLEYWEYNKLGKPASLGCVRLRVKAIKWIYDHCNAGTTVEIYSKEGEKPPIPIPKLVKIKKSDPYSNWDPTDPQKDNPWKTKEKHRS